LGSPADGGQMFFFREQLSKILNMFDRPKQCFGTKVVVFLPANVFGISKLIEAEKDLFFSPWESR
jgi:hypothetical protein